MTIVINEEYRNDRNVRAECLNLTFKFCQTFGANTLQESTGIAKAIYEFVMSDNPTLRTICIRLNNIDAFIYWSYVENMEAISINDLILAVVSAGNFLNEGGTAISAAQ